MQLVHHARVWAARLARPVAITRGTKRRSGGEDYQQTLIDRRNPRDTSACERSGVGFDQTQRASRQPDARDRSGMAPEREGIRSKPVRVESEDAVKGNLASARAGFGQLISVASVQTSTTRRPSRHR